VWLPSFVCPECRTDLAEAGAERFACGQCERSFERRDGVWRFLTTDRGARLEPFIRQYRIVRQSEGRRPAVPDYYRRLPTVAPGDPHATEWLIRRETYHHLLGHVLAAGALPLHVLDLGAGSGWMSHRLAALGHRAVAVDAIDDDADGLGATRHYATDFAAVQADFDALPFAPAQFDLVVLKGSIQ
jgi:2-polyprenyl-3-methyl-5-hydroxy-6-metoxy-1,4-benzoquinol methylase